MLKCKFPEHLDILLSLPLKKILSNQIFLVLSQEFVGSGSYGFTLMNFEDENWNEQKPTCPSRSLSTRDAGKLKLTFPDSQLGEKMGDLTKEHTTTPELAASTSWT